MLRNTESVTKMKKLGALLKELDAQSIQKQTELQEAFDKELIAIKAAQELEPTNEEIKQRIIDHQENYQKLLNELSNHTENQIEDLRKELSDLLYDKKNDTQRAEFRKEFTEKLTALDDILLASATKLNTYVDSNVLREYKKIDVLLFNEINKLANKDLLMNTDRLKISLMISLRSVANYNLEEAEKIANEVITQLEQCMSKEHPKKVSFESITKNVEKILNIDPKDNLFKDLYFAVKEGYNQFIQKKEFLYTNLYNAKKLDFERLLNLSLYDTLIDQDNSRIGIQLQVVEYLAAHKEPKQFYNEIVTLAMKEAETKRKAMEDKNSSSSLGELFNIYQKETLRRLKTELSDIYNQFFIENQFTLPVINMLNHDEIIKMYLQNAARCMQQVNYPDYYSSLNTKQVLQAFDEEEQKALPVPPTYSEPTLLQENTSKLDKYKKMLDKNQISSFKLLINTEKDPATLETLVDTASHSTDKRYSDAVKARFKLFQPQQPASSASADHTDPLQKTALVR